MNERTGGLQRQPALLLLLPAIARAWPGGGGGWHMPVGAVARTIKCTRRKRHAANPCCWECTRQRACAPAAAAAALYCMPCDASWPCAAAAAAQRGGRVRAGASFAGMRVLVVMPVCRLAWSRTTHASACRCGFLVRCTAAAACAVQLRLATHTGCCRPVLRTREEQTPPHLDVCADVCVTLLCCSLAFCC